MTHAHDVDGLRFLGHDQGTRSLLDVARQDVAVWPEVDELVRRLADEVGVAPDEARDAVREGRRVRPSLRWRLRRRGTQPVDERREMLLISFWLLLLLLSVGATVYVSYLARG